MRPVSLILGSVMCALSFVGVQASASETGAADTSEDDEGGERDRGVTSAQSAPWRHGSYFHLYGASGVGRGLRFNNPYRLQTPLGDDAQSLSLSAFYLDLAGGVLLGTPGAVQQGAALHASFALQGIQQEVLTPSYVVMVPLGSRWQARGRLGIPIVLEPDASAGVELALGAVFLVTAGLGITADAIGSLFPGAATPQKTETVIPMVSFQLGVLFDYEVLP